MAIDFSSDKLKVAYVTTAIVANVAAAACFAVPYIKERYGLRNKRLTILSKEEISDVFNKIASRDKKIGEEV